jgi:DNA-directed RNA polymerase specialized sigma24 family protein
MTVSDDTLRVWMQDAKQYLHRYWNHPAYEDIVAEAYLTMWEAISRIPQGTVANVQGYAMRAAWNGAQAYLSSPRNDHRTYNVFKHKECRPQLYLQDVLDAHPDPEEWLPQRLVEPDFVPPLIERLAAEAELAQLKPAKRAALVLCCLHGLTREEARLQLGWSRSKIDKVLARVPFAAIPYAHPGGWRGTLAQLDQRRDAITGRFGSYDP